MTGILPTVDISDLTLDNMTPKPRYFALNEAMRRLRGKDWEFYIKGADELIIRHDSVMVEACNTSFQAHFQVGPEEFAPLYNLTQAVAAPVLAGGVQLAAALRPPALARDADRALPAVGRPPRGAGCTCASRRRASPSAGAGWTTRCSRSSRRTSRASRCCSPPTSTRSRSSCWRNGEVPELKALRLHNGTIYRWTRPCYGILDGKPHLRIENRILPAGPTILDEMANAAFWFGLLSGLSRVYPDIRRVMEFDVAQENFVSAARLGLRAQFAWPGHQHVPADELILKELLPIARDGLAAARHRRRGRRPLPRHPRGPRAHEAHRRAVAARQLRAAARPRQPRRAAGGDHRRDRRAPDRRASRSHRWPLADARAGRRLGEALRAQSSSS